MANLSEASPHQVGRLSMLIEPGNALAQRGSFFQRHFRHQLSRPAAPDSPRGRRFRRTTVSIAASMSFAVPPNAAIDSMRQPCYGFWMIPLGVTLMAAQYAVHRREVRAPIELRNASTDRNRVRLIALDRVMKLNRPSIPSAQHPRRHIAICAEGAPVAQCVPADPKPSYGKTS